MLEIKGSHRAQFSTGLQVQLPGPSLLTPVWSSLSPKPLPAVLLCLILFSLLFYIDLLLFTCPLPVSCCFLISWLFGGCFQVRHCVQSEFTQGKGDSSPTLIGCCDSGAVDSSKWP